MVATKYRNGANCKGQYKERSVIARSGNCNDPNNANGAAIFNAIDHDLNDDDGNQFPVAGYVNSYCTSGTSSWVFNSANNIVLSVTLIAAVTFLQLRR